MCLPVPTVEYSNELDQGSKVRIAQFQRHRRPKTTLVDSRRFAPNQCGGGGGGRPAPGGGRGGAGGGAPRFGAAQNRGQAPSPARLRFASAGINSDS